MAKTFEGGGMAKRKETAVQPIEQAVDTRERIIHAAIECLAEVGYVQTTLQVIARRAGMSHGPLQYHFDSRLDLMAAVAAYLMTRRIAFFAQPMLTPARKRPVLAHFLERIQFYCKTPDFQAVIELEVAARGDAGLRAAIDDATGSRRMFVRDAIQKGAAEQGGSTPAQVAAVMDLLNALAIGLAVGKGAGLNDARARSVWRLLEELLLA
ncbi:MAG TPA: TetR/AcrR family transcriptional regulator [Parvibaculum sp.]|nr:TetR/AcrR family transcriptional regulator [Parvibaculum sp.]